MVFDNQQSRDRGERDGWKDVRGESMAGRSVPRLEEWGVAVAKVTCMEACSCRAIAVRDSTGVCNSIEFGNGGNQGRKGTEEGVNKRAHLTLRGNEIGVTIPEPNACHW